MHKINLKSCKEIVFQLTKWQKVQILKISRWPTRTPNFLEHWSDANSIELNYSSVMPILDFLIGLGKTVFSSLFG
jgi:hypothetical protein